MDDEAVEPSTEEAVRWLLKAEQDLAVAVLVLQSPIGVNWASCFHAQQAAEKALKALLVWQGIDFPRTHDLGRLRALLPAAISSLLDADALDDLAPWAVAGRYPEDLPNPSQAVTEQLVEHAQSATAMARRLIGGASSPNA